MKYPVLEINLDKIEKNAKAIVRLCSQYDIRVSGVVKGVCGCVDIAKAMLAGGVKQIADSRILNFKNLSDNGINTEKMLLRLPMLSNADEVVTNCNISLNSQLSTVHSLGRAAVKRNRIHKVIIMIELGDLREGVLVKDALNFASSVTVIEGIKLEGVGANLSCFGGIIPDQNNMQVLADIAQQIEDALQLKLNIVSGGNSSSLPLLMNGKMPKKINHLRLGESILLGKNTVDGAPLPDTKQDAFILKGEIIELMTKPSRPIGDVAYDAFGNKPHFEDRGNRKRAIVAIGRQDVIPEGISPLCKSVEILGASSDHLLLDVNDSEKDFKIGDIVDFNIDYAALLSAMTSPYVKKILNRDSKTISTRKISIIPVPVSIGANTFGSEEGPSIMMNNGLVDEIKKLDYDINVVKSVIKPLEYDSKFSPSQRLNFTIKESVAIAREAAKAQNEHSFPLFIGGDHTVTIGSFSGLRSVKAKTGMIMFGAHANFNTMTTSQTGNLHGMAAAVCCGMLNGQKYEKINTVEQKDLVIIGVRSIDSEERKRLKDSKINIFSMEQIDALGMREVIEQSIELLRHCSDGIHVSLSMDVVSPEYAPGVSVPVANGINCREAFLAMEMLARSKLPVSMDIVELNPRFDCDYKTAKLAVSLTASLLGKQLIY